MSWINRAEARFGHLAIPGLPRIIVGFNALVFILYKLNPYFLSVLELDRERIMAGEVWRLVTFLFIPSFGGFLPDWIGAVFYILFLWFVGNGVEEAMGSFKLNVFYIVGMLGTMVAAFFFGGSLMQGQSFGNSMLNTSMFFAFARFYPDMMIYLFFILPVKVKWVAWFTAAILLLGLLMGDWPYRAAVIAAMSNYLLFFGADIVRDARDRQAVATRRRRFEQQAKVADDEPMHRCAVCGRTELMKPDLDFRVARDGQEYCLEHLPKPSPPTPV